MEGGCTRCKKQVNKSDTNKITNVEKKDLKDSPPPARRSRRSRDPNFDDSLEVENPSNSNNQSKPSTEKLDDSMNSENEKLDDKLQTRKSRKRNLSTSDSFDILLLGDDTKRRHNFAGPAAKTRIAVRSKECSCKTRH